MKKKDSTGWKFLKFAVIALFTTLSLSGSIYAETLNIGMEENSIDLDFAQSRIGHLVGLNRSLPGKVRLKAAFHIDSGFNEFGKLKLQLFKGDTQIGSDNNCYSIHAPGDKMPKCDLTFNVSSEAAAIRGNFTLKITNTDKRIKKFMIENPYFDPTNALVPVFRSTFTPECPPDVSLDMEGSTITLDKDESKTRDLTGVGDAKGQINIKAKWHTVTLIPNIFVKLKLELIKPNGSVAVSGSFYSVHAPDDKYPRLVAPMFYVLSAADREMQGKWKIRVTNNSDEKIDGFNIEKGNDGNPFVPSFKSIYKIECH